MANAEWLEAMRDDGWIAVLWDGHYAGTGWILFEDAGDVDSWLRWQVSADLLGDKQSWGASYEKLREHEERIPSLPKRSSEGTGKYLAEVRRWLRGLEQLLRGSTLGASHRVFNFDELVADSSLIESYKEFVENPEASPKDDLPGFQAFLEGRYETPTAWARPA
jgi:hypothetical protein